MDASWSEGFNFRHIFPQSFQSSGIRFSRPPLLLLLQCTVQYSRNPLLLPWPKREREKREEAFYCLDLSFFTANPLPLPLFSQPRLCTRYWRRPPPLIAQPETQGQKEGYLTALLLRPYNIEDLLPSDSLAP